VQKSSLNFKEGDIVVVDLPFSDLTGSKLRPVIVLSKENVNAFSSDIVVAKITGTELKSIPQLSLENSDLEEGKSKKKSYISLTSIYTVDKSLIASKIGRVKNSFLAKLSKALREVIV
jgi:mRNA interferase MazF